MAAKADSTSTKLTRRTAIADGGDLFRDPDVSIRTGKRNGDLKRKVAALPFVESIKGGRCFWSVTPTGNYSIDYDQGRAWARLVLPFMEYNLGPPLLSWIAADMVKAGDRGGLMLGFMREIGDQLQAKMMPPLH